MPINRVRFVKYCDDGVSEYQCLSCYESWRASTSPEGWTFCPYCGTKWDGVEGDIHDSCERKRFRYEAMSSRTVWERDRKRKDELFRHGVVELGVGLKLRPEKKWVFQGREVNRETGEPVEGLRGEWMIWNLRSGKYYHSPEYLKSAHEVKEHLNSLRDEECEHHREQMEEWGHDDFWVSTRMEFRAIRATKQEITIGRV